MMNLIRKNKSFRILLLFFICNDSSVILLQMANGWLTLSVTESVFWTGGVFGVAGVGVVLFSLFGGVLADRMNRKKILQITQPIDFCCAIILTFLIYFNLIKLWEILLIVFINGAIGGIRLPTREALLLDIVGRKNLLKAISITFILFTIVGFCIPLINGILIDINMSFVYLLSSILILLSFLFITRLNLSDRNYQLKKSPFGDLKEVFNYILDKNIIKQILFIILISEVFGWAHNSMIPVMIREVFKLPATSLGVILSCGSVGAVVGTIIISQLSTKKNISYMYMVFGLMGFGGFLILFGLSSHFYLAVFFLSIAWAFAFAFEVKIYAYLQMIISDSMRGRILSLLAMSYGLSSVSGFLSGFIGNVYGPRFAIVLFGIIIVVSSFYAIFKLKKIDEEVPDLNEDI